MADIATAEAMVNEASCMVAEAEAVWRRPLWMWQKWQNPVYHSLSAHFVTLKLSSI